MAQLEAGRLDLLLLALPCACGDAETLAIAADPFLAALPAGHRLAARDRVPVGALAAERLLLLEDGHCLREHALDACGLPRGTLPGEEGFAATSLHTLVQMVASGLGVTLVPRLAVDGGVLAGTAVEVRPLETAAPPRRRRAAAWPWPGAPAARARRNSATSPRPLRRR